MDTSLKDQIGLSLSQIFGSIAKSYTEQKEAKAGRDALTDRVGGFIRGVCHPYENFRQLSEANIGWVRMDIPYPYGDDGKSLSQSYLDFKEKCARFVAHGFKIMAITPYAKAYIDRGVDVRVDEERVKEIARFMLTDLQGLIHGVQLTNEIGMPQFTYPLTVPEGARFIGIQAEAVSDVKGNIIVGYNSAGPQVDLNELLKPYFRYMDYAGIDIYLGCFYGFPGFLWIFSALIRYLSGFTGLPVILQEFGYIGAGAPKTKAEKKAILESYGVSSEEDAKAHIEEFIEKLPREMKDRTRMLVPDVSKQWSAIFESDMKNHLYRELPVLTRIPGCPHTPGGQAQFYLKLLPRLYALDCLAGTIVYCYADADVCYTCGQTDCPTETRWGLVTVDDVPKPSYYAVRKVFGNIIKDEKLRKKRR